MKDRDTRKNIRGYRDEYREILKEKGIFKNTSSLTNINLECGQLDQKLKKNAFKQDPTVIREDQDVVRQHRILNAYVQGFQKMLCLNQKKKDGDTKDEFPASKSTLTVDFSEYNKMRLIAQGTGYDH